MREQIRVAVPRESGQAKRFLINRCRGNSRHIALLRVGCSADDGVVRRLPRVGRKDAGLKLRARLRAVQDRFADAEHARVGCGAARDLRSDAGRIPFSNRDTGFHVCRLSFAV